MKGTRACDEYAVIETFPPQEFRFFRHYYITSSFFAVFFIGLVFVAWVPLAMAAWQEGFPDAPVVRAAVYSTVAFLLCAALGLIGKRESARTRFIVSFDGIVRRDPYRTVSMAWRDITFVRGRRMPGAKGALEIRTSHTRILLPSTIESFGRLCDEIRKGLERAGRPAVMDSVLLRDVVAMGTMSERWNERARAAFWPIVGATLGTLLFNAFVASRVWEAGSVTLIIWAGISLPMPLLAYAVADFRLNRQCEKALLLGNETPVKDNLAGELAFGFLAVAPFYGILGIIARTIFLP
ncbi:MAG: hypothetical protein JXA71_06080 [Chitinispirillaceae bacterium]|nr:hypothetical protein [Chitinispirillaceae bacterium]